MLRFFFASDKTLEGKQSVTLLRAEWYKVRQAVGYRVPYYQTQ